jgi:phage baseplate assembly protein V
MLRYGTVSEKDSAGGLLRVDFSEDGIVSDWLPMVVAAGAKNSFFALPDVGEQVACLMDTHAENGVVLGAIYSSEVKPKQAGNDISSVVFDDGTKVIYDRAAHTLLIDTVGDVTIKTTANVLVECVNATVKASTKTLVDTPNAQFTGNVQIDGGLGVNGAGEIKGTVTARGNVNVSVDVNVQGGVTTGGDVRAGSGTVGLLTHIHPTPAGPSSTGVG